MKRIFPLLTLAVLLVLPFVPAYAQQIPPTIFGGPQDVIDLIVTITNWIFTAVLVLAAMFLVYAGFQFVTSGGDPKGFDAAKGMLINALIGVGVAVAALGLVNVVKTILR